MIGGTAHVEMPVSEIWKLLEEGTTLLNEFMTPSQKQTYKRILGKLFEIKTIKADLIFRGEQILQGIYEVAMDYTFVHKDGAEEKGIFKLEGKKAIVKAQVELPVFEIFELKTIKADINFNGEQILHGIYDVTVHYSFVHKEGTEEKTKFMLEGKKATIKVNVELPVSEICKIFELGTNLLTELMTPVQKQVYEKIFGMLYEIKFIKADIILNGEQILQGMYNIAMDYTFVHKDGTEEIGTFMVQGKKETGMLITSVEVISKTLETIPNQIIYPSQTTIVCNWLTHDITVTGTFCKIFVNFSISESGITARGVLEYLGHQYKSSAVLSLSEKFFTLTYQEVFNLNVALTAGKMDLTLMYDNGVSKTNHLIVEYQPTNEASPLAGGNIKMVAIRESVPFLEFGGYIGLTINTAKYELLFNNFYVHVVNALMLEEVANIFNINMFNVCTTFNWCFSEAGFNGKVFIDRINKYGFLNKMAVEAEATKDKKTIFNFILTTVETTPRLYIFCPFILEKVLDVEHLELKLDHVVTGDEKRITICLNNMKLVVKMIPSMIESELLIGQVSHLKYVHEFKFENNEISFLMAGKSKLHLHKKSPLYKSLYYLSPTYACFKDMTSDYHVEVVDKATGKVDVRYQVLKDTLEMFYLEINTVRAPSLFIFKSPYLVASIGYEHLTKEMKVSININQMCLLKFTLIDENKYEVTINGETLVHLVFGKKHVEIITMHKYIPSLTTMITLKTLSFFENSIDVQLLHKQTAHTTHFGWNMSKLAEAFVEVKVTGSGTSLLGEYAMLHHLRVTPIGKNKYEVKLNDETLVHLVPGKKTIEIITQHEDIPTLTTIITWKTLSIFKNTIGIQLLYKEITHKTLLAWNINKLVKAFVEVKVTGSGTTLLGEYELFHHLNWNIINIKNMDLMWNSKALITGLPYLKTPRTNDGILVFKDYVIDMKVVGQLKPKTYTLLFKTKPFKIALLPFFEFP